MVRKRAFLLHFIVLLCIASFYGCEQPNEITADSFPENELVQFYNGEIKLSNEEVSKLCEEIIKENSDNYLMALAYYQTGYLQRKNNENFDAFESYDSARFYLQNAAYTDNYLASAILRNQGVILKHHGSLEDALLKYEEALPYASEYSLKRKLSVMHNIGRVQVYLDTEKALNTFSDIIEIAKKEGLNEREAKAYKEIGKALILGEKYEAAKAYFHQALEIAESDAEKASVYHNLSQVYFYRGDYQQQEALLLQALELQPKKFITMVDLGECYMMQKLNDKALQTLMYAESLYDDQLLLDINIDVFNWLKLITDFPMKYDYAEKQYEQQIQIKETENRLANYLLENKEKELTKASIGLENEISTSRSYSQVIIVLIAFAIMIIITWRLWWVWLKKSIASDVRKVLHDELPD